MRGLLTKLRLVLAELGRPGAQKDNWFLWAAGQMGHAMIGAVLAGALLFFLPPMWAFLAAALGYAAVKEVPDYLRAPGWAGARDSVQDALFVAAGAALAVAIAGQHDRLFLVAVVAAVIGLTLGVWQRIAKGS
jgi:nitrate reductase gamma subunit